MFVKVLQILIIMIFINLSQTVQPQKNNLPKNKTQTKINQGNNIAKNVPQINRWSNMKNKPQSKLTQEIDMQKKVPKPKLNQSNNLPKRKPQINQRNVIPRNKPQPNLKPKNNTPIKLPQKKQGNNTPKNIQAKQKNNIPKNKPQKNEWNNISQNNLQRNQINNIPKKTPRIKAKNNVLKDKQLSELKQGNNTKYVLQKNASNNISKNVPQTNRPSNVPKNMSPLKSNQWNNITKDTPQQIKDSMKKKKWKFQDYLKKFEPTTIWEQIDKQRKYNGRQISDEEQMEIMLRGMDPTDEIMKLKIEDGDAKMIVQPDGRRGWKPGSGLHWYQKDKFHLRRRLYELMKQAIYQARNKMITMQVYREKYKSHGLYKMGFLMNKADNAAKTFGKFSFRAFRNCLLKREAVERPPLFDLLTTNERQLNLWFNVEIIVDLINKNDKICKEIFLHNRSSRQQLFDEQFVDK